MTTAEATPPEQRASFMEQVRELRRPFWAANVMELIERLAYYGVRVVVPIYIASSEDPAGLHFTNTDKGIILTAWALIQSLVPMFSGGFADRYGRKRTIAISIAIKMVGYVLMATQRNFWGFFLGCQVLALGTAVFKPGVQGTLVRGTTRKNSSLAWGFFYQVVNIGGWLGPPLAGYLHHYAWKWVFLSCAAIVSLNFITLLTYQDEPDAPAPDLESAPFRKPGEREGDVAPTDQRSPLAVLLYSVKTVFRPRLLSFILVMSGFWVMFMQLYDALPNFIEEWVDSRAIVSALGLSEGLLAQPTSRGLQVPQEWMINLDASAIILFMIPIALLTARLRRLVAICVGIFIACCGLLLAGVTMSGWMCLFGIFVFAIGEMVASPKMNEYLGVIAPRGEEALYMGYANVPVAVGWTSGAYVAGFIYDRLADKANLAARYLHEQLHYTGEVPRTSAMKILQETTHQDATSATEMLWSVYHPYVFWYLFFAVGLMSAIGMVIYARIAKRWIHENA